MWAYALIPCGRSVFVEIGEITPAVLYDDRCRLCARFAGAVGRLGGSRILLVGHYSPLGERIRRSLLGSDALDMFWFIDPSTAYGGRAGLLPLIRAILSARAKKFGAPSVEERCDAGCKDAGAVFVRSASLLTNSRRIPLEGRPIR